MAEILKVGILRFTKRAFFVLLVLLALAYVKLKFDVFLEHCTSADKENKLTRVRAGLINVWIWLTSNIWRSSHGQQLDNESVPSEGDTIPPCHASMWDILSHVVVTGIRKDLVQFCVKVMDIIGTSCTSIQHTLRMIGTEGKVIFISVFDSIAESVRKMWGKLQDGFNVAMTKTAIVYKELCDYFGTITIVVFFLFCLLSVVLICWRKRKHRQVRNGFYHHQNQSHKSYHGSQDFTPLSTQTQKPRTEIVQSFDPDFAKQICIRTKHNMETDSHRFVSTESTKVRYVALSLVYMMVVLLCVSVPWEFCRLYQLAVANKAAVASAGVPLECSTESLSLLQTLTLWLSRQLAWSHGNPCDRYYQAVFVDPLWEITPLMVLTSMVTRSVLHPMEMLSAGLGRALRHFFTEIPLHWQPVCMLLIVTFTFVVLLLSCSYRFSIPMLFRIEPRTPVLACSGRREETKTCGRVVGDGVVPRRAVSAFGEDTTTSLARGQRTGDVSRRRLAEDRCLDCWSSDCRQSTSNLCSQSRNGERRFSGLSDQLQKKSPSMNSLEDQNSSVVPKWAFNITSSRDVARVGRFRRNGSPGLADDVVIIDDQKENLESKVTGNRRRRRDIQRNVLPERISNVSARLALHDMVVMSKNDRSSAVDVNAKQKAGTVKTLKTEGKRSGRRK